MGNIGWDGITRLGTLPSGSAPFSIEAYKEKSCEEGGDQWGEIIIKNNSGTRYLLEFDVVVTTICGNQASQHYALYLDGNDQQFGARAVIWVHAKTCARNKVAAGTMLTANEVNRISSVGFKGLTYNVRELATGNPGPTNTDQSQTTRANATPSNTYATSRSTSTFTPPTTATPQQQQHQQAANTYLNAANTADNGIERAKNMNLAQINAMAAGNTAQIQQQINQQVYHLAQWKKLRRFIILYMLLVD